MSSFFISVGKKYNIIEELFNQELFRGWDQLFKRKYLEGNFYLHKNDETRFEINRVEKLPQKNTQEVTQIGILKLIKYINM